MQSDLQVLALNRLKGKEFSPRSCFVFADAYDEMGQSSHPEDPRLFVIDTKNS
jgi:hypothetical protein